MTEKELVFQLKQKKTQSKAFKVLVDQYKERLYWHIRKIVIHHQDADDVLQNTFVKVLNHIQNFKEDSKLYTWMYRIATNESINYIQKRAKVLNVDLQDYQTQLANTLQDDELFDGEQIQILLQKAIARLPQKQQLVFNMKYFDEMKYEDMSEILDTSVGALKASYHHAVKKIENYLKQH